MYFEIEQNFECFKPCKFWSRKAMRMVDTGLESLDFILFITNKFGYHGGTHGTQKWLPFNAISWLENFTLTYKWNITTTRGTPWYPKCQKIKSTRFGLSNAVSTILIAFLDQNLQGLKHSKFCSISKYIRKCDFLL